ncbi:MAG: DUF1801 domain-containing protein [Pseudomonadales bacterium]|nr:DUF1801 domain-containing protein [Pseudomonadales bacterium]
MSAAIQPNVQTVFDAQPEPIRIRLLYLRQLILETAFENEIGTIEETLKWREPNYLARKGSTIRINRVKSNPDQVAIYFNCKTKFGGTFRELYCEEFNFESNRAIIFYDKNPIPVEALKHCILLSLTYRNRKNLPLLRGLRT